MHPKTYPHPLDFLDENKIGLMLRVFAKNEEDIPKRVELVENVIERVRKCDLQVDEHNAQGIISRVDVLVPEDNRYRDSDCGKTAGVLAKHFHQERDVYIEGIPEGDVFCSVGNYGFLKQFKEGMTYTVTLSPEVHSYLNHETMKAVIKAACKGARAIGVAINELTESVLEGRLAGTFAMWHIPSLLMVGGLDLCAQNKRVDDRLAHFMRGWSQEKGEVLYELHGVEEMLPLARMVDHFGPCIAPILPLGKDIGSYQVPDPKTQPELWERHWKKMGTKFERQAEHLASAGFHPTEWLKYGVMPEYQQPHMVAAKRA